MWLVFNVMFFIFLVIFILELIYWGIIWGEIIVCGYFGNKDGVIYLEFCFCLKMEIVKRKMF